jgi:dTDP-4-dehydrorhamnose reductase
MVSASLFEHDLFRKPASTHRVEARGQAFRDHAQVLLEHDLFRKPDFTFRDHAQVMRILVTGVTGQVGGALARRLPPSAAVLTADRSVLDLAAPQTLAAALDRLEPDLIFNPAAYTAVDKAEDEPDLAARINVEAPGAMARWAAARGVPLIHFSTDYVFDGSGARAWREDDTPQPLSVYGATKLAGENAVRGAGGPFLIVRTSWVYAAAGKNFLRTIARLARERSELRVVNDQIGAPTSAALIADVAAGMLADGLNNFWENCARAGGLVHLAACGETSWYEFAGAIVEGLKARGVALALERIVPIASEDYPTRAQRPRNSRLDLSRLQAVFGIAPPSWQNALVPELDRLPRELTATYGG